ncbi:MAG TPA: murein biosynthesis integral membrane protein MurJ [Chthoniobacterales bacterium]
MLETKSAESPAPPKKRSASVLVAAGILLSRIAGLVRQRVFAHYFGNSAAADAFNAAFRIPNLLQNLFGEGALSASFIPVYARLLAQNNEKEAGRVAGAIASLIVLVVTLIVLAGVLLAPWLVQIIAPGFGEDRRDLTVALVRILFPGAGLLVLSAWCLGILNSHRKFFLSYTAPVLWNAVMITALVWLGGRSSQEELAVSLAWASVVGSGAQFLIQLPVVLRLAKRLSFFTKWRSRSVRTVLKNFLPAFFSRGVVQISAYVDSVLASLLGVGAVAGITYAQVLYTLPVSLFGMSVSAAELPEMSSALGNQEEIAARLRERLQSGMKKIALMIVPSVAGFLTLGDVVSALVYQTGKFLPADARYVWLILAGSSVGMLASTLGRLYSSAWYALGDTRKPFLFSCARIAVSTVLGIVGAIFVPHWFGIPAKWGVLGITLGAAVGAWVEFFLLRRALWKQIGNVSLSWSYYGKLWLAAAVAASDACLLRLTPIADWHPVVAGGLMLGLFGVVYFVIAALMGIADAQQLIGKFTGQLKRLRK